MTKKLHIKTWGCQMNEYDSSKMADLLDATHGYQLTDVAEEADVLLLNTCSIREKAQEKVFHQLGRWKLLKEKNPDLIIGVGGCVASQEGEHIRQRAHYVDIIFGPQTLTLVPVKPHHYRSNYLSTLNFFTFNLYLMYSSCHQSLNAVGVFLIQCTDSLCCSRSTAPKQPQIPYNKKNHPRSGSP